MSLQGLKVLITGGTRGIGLASAKSFLQEGAHITIASRKLEHVHHALEELDHPHAYGFACHVGDGQAREELVEQCLQAMGGLDVLVNNAATNPHFGPLLKANPEHWQKIFDVNLMGAFGLTQLCYPALKASGRASVINIASVAGLKVYPGMGIYSVFKAGLIMMTRVLAAELGPQNIRVNAVAPGFIKTDFAKAIWEEPAHLQPLLATTPLRRMGTPEEIAQCICWLANPQNSFTTGSILTSDGGLTL